MKFEWNHEKEKINIKKHKVTFEQAAYVFSDKYALTLFDNDHSDDEDRWILLGNSLNQMILVVVHTFRDKFDVEVVRIISARKATKDEIKAYQERYLK